MVRLSVTEDTGNNNGCLSAEKANQNSYMDFFGLGIHSSGHVLFLWTGFFFIDRFLSYLKVFLIQTGFLINGNISK